MLDWACHPCRSGNNDVVRGSGQRCEETIVCTEPTIEERINAHDLVAASPPSSPRAFSPSPRAITPSATSSIPGLVATVTDIFSFDEPSASPKLTAKEIDEELALKKQLEMEAIAKAAIAKEEQENNKRVETFLKRYKYEDVNQPRGKSSCCSSTREYPLHTAVTNNDATIVTALLVAGASYKSHNHKNQTPLRLANIVSPSCAAVLRTHMLQFHQPGLLSP